MPNIPRRPTSTYPLTWLDVFTATPLTGNGLAVVHGADDIDDARMLGFARETRLSETTFVQSPPDGEADYVNRIWTMGGELPFAGHPSLGTAVAVALERGHDEATFVQQTPAGLQPCEVRISGRHAAASMLQEPAAFGEELEPGEALAALGLDPRLAVPELPEQVVSTGVKHVMAPISDPAALAGARPDREALAGLIERTGTVVVFVAHVDAGSGEVRARSFAAAEGIGEDPATGSAAGPLCAHTAARIGVERLRILSGVEMGRPSVMHAQLEGDRVRVSGDVVVLFDGTIHLDG